MMRRAVLASFLLSIAGAVLVDASPASADCAAPTGVGHSMRYAELVFVGSAEQVTNEGRWATFVIDELWKGTPESRRIEVHGGPKGRMHSSVERSYRQGARYLVMATDPEAGGYDSMYDSNSRFEDNACSGTRPYVAALERYRPNPHPPLPAATTVISQSDGVPAAAIVLVVAAGITAAGLAVWRPWRRRRRRSEV